MALDVANRWRCIVSGGAAVPRRHRLRCVLVDWRDHQRRWLDALWLTPSGAFVAWHGNTTRAQLAYRADRVGD